MNRISSLLVATAALVGAANVGAYAATGAPLLGGRANLTTGMTTIHRTKPGPALALKVRPGSAPLAVSSGTRVFRLNADKLDGLDSSVLKTRAYTYTLASTPTPVEQYSVLFPKLPQGTYLVSFAISSETTPIAASPVFCALYTDPSAVHSVFIDWGTHDTDGDDFSSASGTVVHRYTRTPRLTCGVRDSGETFTLWRDVPSTVTFTRLDSNRVSAAQAAPARP